MRLVSRLKSFIQCSPVHVAGLLEILLVSAIATAQPNNQPKYRFDHWTIDDGLPQNAVNAILQTRDGYLWLATLDGLARFNGLHFTIFNRANTKGIESNRFEQLFEDRSGVLWALTEENWLVKYQAGVFATYSPGAGSPSWIVQQIEEDEAGNFQVVAAEGIAKWKDGRFNLYALSDLIPPHFFGLTTDATRLSRYTRDHLYWYSRGRLKELSLQSGLPSLKILSAHEDQFGTIWINTRDAGLVRVKDGRFNAYQFKDGERINAPIQEDAKGNIWLAGEKSWLGRIKDGRLTRYSTSEGFPASSITTFYEDREGNFWIGSSTGLFRAREEVIKVHTQQERLSSNNIYSICEDRAGGLWFGTWGNGVSRFHNGHFTNYWMKDGQARGFITALYEDGDGYLWIGSTNGIFRLKDDRVSAFPDPNRFFRDGVWVIYQDRAGRFWFGANKGLIKYEDGLQTRYTSADGLAGNDIKAILEDRAGRLWLGTWSGLSCYDRGRITSFTERDGLASDHIRTLYEDADGTLWIGTYDGGLSRFKDGRFTRYTTNDGLFNNGVFRILEDDRGNFWMSSNKGIYRVRRQELNDFAEGKISSITSVAFGKKDGLLNVECNGGRQPAGWKTRDGRLWFPTAHGAAVIDPSRVEFNQQPPPVVIEEVRLNNQVAPLSRTIVISPDNNNSLEIRYQGLSFIRPEQQQFKYQLAGIDPGWVEAGDRRTANYNRLPPGNYVFSVLAANSDGVWNTLGSHIQVKVQPSFWQTWWFKAGILTAIMICGLIVIRRRIRRRRHEQAMRDAHSRQLIDAQERDRKRIACDLHDSTGQLVNLISHHALDGLGEPDNYDLVTQRFAKIAALAGETIKGMRLVAYNLRPLEIDRLGLTRALETLVNQFKALPSINFTCEIDQIDSAFDEDGKVHLYRIVQESLTNIIRHSQATEASLVIKRDVKAVRIEIRDNGKGFELQAHSATNGSRSGLGLTGIFERARLLGGQAEIQTAPGRGVNLIVLIVIREVEL